MMTAESLRRFREAIDAGRVSLHREKGQCYVDESEDTSILRVHIEGTGGSLNARLLAHGIQSSKVATVEMTPPQVFAAIEELKSQFLEDYLPRPAGYFLGPREFGMGHHDKDLNAVITHYCCVSEKKASVVSDIVLDDLRNEWPCTKCGLSALEQVQQL